MRGRPAKALGSVLLAAGLFVPSASRAKIDLVTLPGRDTTQLSIYKSEDLTLVREVRSLTFNTGLNEIQFSWANTLIDPTSLQIRMVKNSPDFRVLDARYPANTQNTIVWNIEAARQGTAQVEITYFASGLNWRADYSVFANDDETALRLEPNFTVSNNSGEDFEDAQTRLVVGEINLVQAIEELARRGILLGDRTDQNEFRQRAAKSMMRDEAMWSADGSLFAGASMAPAVLEEAKEIVKAAVSEYYLYTIEGTEDLESGWGKQLPNPRIQEVPVDVSYEYNPNKYGSQVIKFYKFKNDEGHELGETPLPEGAWYAFSGDGREGLRFQGSTTHKYIPVGEDVELNLGSDGLVLLEQRVMSESRSEFDFDSSGNVVGYDVTRDWEIEVRNSRNRAIPIKITRPMGTGDWTINDASDHFRKVDRATAEWEIDVDPLSRKVVTFTVVERTGTRNRVN